MAIKSSTCIAALTAILLSAPANAAVYPPGTAGLGQDLDTYLERVQMRPEGAPGGGGGNRGGGGGPGGGGAGGGVTAPPGGGGDGAVRGPDAGARGGGEARGDRAERRELRQERREERRETREERREDRRDSVIIDRDRSGDRDRVRDGDRDRRDGVRDRDRDRRWSGGIRWWRDDNWHDRRRWRRGVLVIGGYDIWYDPAPPYIIVRHRADAAWRRAMARCYEDFRSFNPRTGMYVTYGGERKLCPYLRPFIG